MIVCSCNVLTDGEVKSCLDGSASAPRTAAEVYTALGCAPRCGRCATTIRGILKDNAAVTCCKSDSACDCLPAHAMEHETADA
ncbi:MAG: domain protein (2Fe-2S)-binding domain protein [Hyphomicrobiales bacterium]|nr:domain protein (2Fe-2S)-binding domain protein [Hyphomicrobiales bacterium]